MQPPKLRLAPSAKEELAQCIAEIQEFRPVVALIWAVGARQQSPTTKEWRTLEPHWRVGFYDASDLPGPSSQITEIEGIPFVFGSESDHLLDGGELYYSGGRFHVSKSAI
jgi:hypothetical protein